MTPITQAKLILALTGIALFGYGIRIGIRPVSWAGIALVFVAWLLRFMGGRSAGR